MAVQYKDRMPCLICIVCNNYASEYNYTRNMLRVLI